MCFFRCVESFGVCKRLTGDLEWIWCQRAAFPRCGEQKTGKIFSPLTLAAVGRQLKVASGSLGLLEPKFLSMPGVKAGWDESRGGQKTDVQSWNYSLDTLWGQGERWGWSTLSWDDQDLGSTFTQLCLRSRLEKGTFMANLDQVLQTCNPRPRGNQKRIKSYSCWLWFISSYSCV